MSSSPRYCDSHSNPCSSRHSLLFSSISTSRVRYVPFFLLPSVTVSVSFGFGGRVAWICSMIELTFGMSYGASKS